MEIIEETIRYIDALHHQLAVRIEERSQGAEDDDDNGDGDDRPAGAAGRGRSGGGGRGLSEANGVQGLRGGGGDEGGDFRAWENDSCYRVTI